MNRLASGVLNPTLAGAATSGLLYHMARPYDDGVATYTPQQSMVSMARNEYIEGQATKGYFARPEGIRSVSFSSSRLADLGKLVSRRSEFGICFDRQAIDPFSIDIKPVHYLERGAIEAIKRNGVYPSGLDARHRYWIDLEDEGTYSFSWEEEWRKLGDLEFNHDSVVFLIVPTAFISAELFALGYPIVPSDAINNPAPYVRKIDQLVDEARAQLSDDQEAGEVDEVEIEENYLVRLARRYTSSLHEDFYPKNRAKMREDVEQGIYTASGELRDPNGEWNTHEAFTFDQDNKLDEIFEDND